MAILNDSDTGGRALRRREFLALAGASAVLPRALLSAQGGVTAQELVDRIYRTLGAAAPLATSVDGVKAGRPDTRATGVAITAMATLDVLRRAAAAKRNLVITYEPTFYGRAEDSAARPDDPIASAKRRFIGEQGLVVWRLHDVWRSRTPDPFVDGLSEALGWDRYRTGGTGNLCVIPPRPLGDVVAHVRTLTRARGGIRVVGDRNARITRVVLSPGASSFDATFKTLPEADLVIAGEPREWEGVVYAQDTVTAGHRKGMILVGRVLSEDPGMNVLARHLATIIREVPVEWVPVGDPYWRPV